MTRALIVAAMVIVQGLANARAADLPAVVTRESPIRIWVDQIGYREIDRKLAVVASAAALPQSLQIELRDCKTNSVVWRNSDHPRALTQFNGGIQDTPQRSGEFIDYLDFSDFHASGRYYFVLTGSTVVRSYQFNIAPNPYHAAGLAAWKAYYYSRADGELPEKYGGLWHHGKCFLGPFQATQARVYRWKTGNRWPESVGTELVDSQTYDVHGGWWDAGDLNKYTSNTVNVVCMLYMAYEMVHAGTHGALPSDGELHIPESGNGIPDVLDEIQVGTEFLIRDCDSQGASFGRLHQEPGSPPESVKAPDQLTAPNSETTMGRAAALAYAAVVWHESRLDDAFAQRCRDEAFRSWNLLQRRPHPWPVDPDHPDRILSQGEMRNDADYANWRAIAAASFFRLTGEKRFDEIVRENFAARNLKNDSTDPALWIYLHAKGADPAIVSRVKREILQSADATLTQLGNSSYRVYVPGFWWGSNSTIGDYGSKLVLGSLLSGDAAKKQAYLDGAADYVHYLFGRNPRGECYLSNMKAFGAEKSAVVMFHSWVGNVNSKDAGAQKYIGGGPGKIGPFPGYTIGGPNGSMTKLIEDENLDWRQDPWDYTEPDIAYQSCVLRLLDTFIWP